MKKGRKAIIITLVFSLLLSMGVVSFAYAEQELAEPIYQFNFGNNASPVKDGWTPILLNSTGNSSTTGYDYNPAEGRTYGLVFNGLSLNVRNRGNLSGSATTQILPGTSTPVYSGLLYDPMTSSWIGGNGWGFNADLPAGAYDVVIFCTEMNSVGSTPSKAAKNTVRFEIEGDKKETMNVFTHRLSKNASNQILPYYVVYDNVSVQDGTLNIGVEAPPADASINSWDSLLEVTMNYTLANSQGYVNGIAIYPAGKTPSLAQMLDNPAAVVGVVSFDGLEAALESALEIKLDGYTAESITPLETALSNAEKILQARNAPQSAVDKAAGDIAAAIAGLKRGISASSRQEAYKVNEMITLDVITDISAENVMLKNESGTYLCTSSKTFVEEDGYKHWTLTMALGTIGDRVLSVSAAGQSTTVSFRLTKRMLALSAPDVIDANAPFKITAAVDSSVDDIQLYDEQGAPVAATKVRNGNTITMTLSLAAAPSGRVLTAKAYDAADQLLDSATISFAVVNDVSVVEARTLLPIYLVDETITFEVITGPNAQKVVLKNEAGASLYTDRSSVEENGRKVWTLTTALGTAGNRTLGVFVDGENCGTVSFRLTGRILLVAAPSKINPNELFRVTASVDAAVADVELFDGDGNKLEIEKQRNNNVYTINLAIDTNYTQIVLVTKALAADGSVVAENQRTIEVAGNSQIPASEGVEAVYSENSVRISVTRPDLANNQVAVAVYKPGYTGKISGWFDGLSEDAVYVNQVQADQNGSFSITFPLKSAKSGKYTVLLGGRNTLVAYFDVA